MNLDKPTDDNPQPANAPESHPHSAEDQLEHEVRLAQVQAQKYDQEIRLTAMRMVCDNHKTRYPKSSRAADGSHKQIPFPEVSDIIKEANETYLWLSGKKNPETDATPLEAIKKATLLIIQNMPFDDMLGSRAMPSNTYGVFKILKDAYQAATGIDLNAKRHN